MDSERLFIEEMRVIIVRLELQTEQLRLHVEGLKNHTFKDEVARENDRLRAMMRQLESLKKLKELYDATLVTDPNSSPLPH
jgi:hypothetical protein